jgi:hypothetical protein
MAWWVAPTWKRLWEREKENEMNSAPLECPTKSLAWLADAPMFIDALQVSSFYDAVVRPESEEKAITISLKGMKTTTYSGSATAGVEVSLASVIKKWFPFLDAKANLEGSAAAEMQRGEEQTDTVELKPISTPQRQLVQLALHYAVHIPDRVKVVSLPGDASWYSPEFIAKTPRALLFLDLPPETVFLPTAAELGDGKVITFYSRMPEELRCKPTEMPVYPDATRENDEAKLNSERKEYWKWFHARFEPKPIMQLVEETILQGGSRVRWIDYRLPIADDGTTLHLHVCGRAEYDTGVFAYNLVKRGHRHGVRIVGTLKSEPDMNVLAIYEK